MYDVIALGELLIDFAAISNDAEGYPTMAAHPGGAPANFLAAVNKFGGKTALIGKVGKDSFGQLLLKTLENSGIDIAGMRQTDEYFTRLPSSAWMSTATGALPFPASPVPTPSFALRILTSA